KSRNRYATPTSRAPSATTIHATVAKPGPLVVASGRALAGRGAPWSRARRSASRLDRRAFRRFPGTARAYGAGARRSRLRGRFGHGTGVLCSATRIEPDLIASRVFGT